MGYSKNEGNYNNCNGGYEMNYSKGNSSTFVLIIVLFILLIIVGASFMQSSY